jgi:dipeptidyl aminopeptidase/acylaminoacyl peptidase
VAIGHRELPPRLIDATTGKQLRRFIEQTDSNTVLAFSPDGKMLASGENEGLYFLWERATGKLIRKFGTPPEGPQHHQYNIFSVFSPDGKWIAVSGTNHPVRLCPVDPSQRVREFRDRGCHAAVFTPDSRILALDDAEYIDGTCVFTVRLHETATGKELAKWIAHENWVRALAISPDGQWLATGSYDKTVALWELATGKELRRFRGHQAEVVSLSFAPDGKTLASASSDHTILLWPVPDMPSKAGRSVQHHWDHLASDDEVQVFQARYALLADPERSVPFLKVQLRLVPTATSAQLTRLIADLDDKEFAVRSKAFRELEELEIGAAEAIIAALDANPSPEVSRRLQQLLDRVAQPTTEQSQAIKGVEILRQIATPSAKEILTHLARGASGARLTLAAERALKTWPE